MYFPNVFRATASVDARVRSTLFRARIRRRHRRIAASPRASVARRVFHRPRALRRAHADSARARGRACAID
jgi:hypothetical protein